MACVCSKLLDERPQCFRAHPLALHGGGDLGHACPKVSVLLDQGAGVSGLGVHEGGDDHAIFFVHLAGERLREFSPEGRRSLAVACLDGFERGRERSLEALVVGGEPVA